MHLWCFEEIDKGAGGALGGTFGTSPRRYVGAERIRERGEQTMAITLAPPSPPGVLRAKIAEAIALNQELDLMPGEYMTDSYMAGQNGAALWRAMPRRFCQ